MFNFLCEVIIPYKREPLSQLVSLLMTILITRQEGGFAFCVKKSLQAKPFIKRSVPPSSSFSCKSNSFWYDRFSVKTRFETKAQGNLEMVYSFGRDPYMSRGLYVF